MKFLIIQGMPITTSLRQVWKRVGAVIAKRNSRRIPDLVRIHEPKFVLNLGSRDTSLSAIQSVPLFNMPQTIQPLSNPRRLRDFMPEFLPPQPTSFPADAWFKLAGFGGRGKERFTCMTMPVLNGVADVQLHVEGQEYRVITVGSRVVQVHARYGDNIDRSYRWLGLGNTPPPVKKRARQAASLLGCERTVIGWDLIDNNDEVFVLEGNTCPGVNLPTAQRIVNEIIRQLEGA